MTPRRRAAVALALPLTLAIGLAIGLVIAPASDARKKAGKRAARIEPKIGIYSAEPIKPSGDFLLGSFAVVRDRKGLRIVSIETADGIYYPNLQECAHTSHPLRKDALRVRHNDRFSIREKRRTPEGRQVVRWTGRWIRPGKVRGKVRIRIKKCRSSYRWKAHRLPPGAG